ncbi:unnamed protein product [Rotaria sp. Silwood1]|nr:unnamed protein product [Rotaria sp. Silwood1]CAF4690493.1 unnamed protein product [Rotaria sp. Silwood1]
MSNSYLLLNLLPVELLHEIFHYLSTIDIFNAFSNINYYLDSSLLKYEKYHINFRSCLKKHFDFICIHIQPHQIISLILSNSDDTPEQFQIFFTLFNIEQFTSLRSITLIDIENDLLLNLIDNLTNSNINKYLESFKIIRYDLSDKNIPDYTITKLLPYRLKQLDVYNASCVMISLSNLRYLTVHNCTINELQQILSLLPMLWSLDVTNHTGGQWKTMDKVPTHLKRLVLNLDVWMSMVDIEEFLLKLPYLKHLELQINGNLVDLCNGERWSILTKYLITFNFNFTTKHDIVNFPYLLINSFCSSFWLEEKQWFIAYNNRPSHLFTVPRFADKSAYYSTFSSFRLPIYTTITSDQSLFYDCINELTISKSLQEPIPDYRFTHVKILSLSNSNVFNRLQFIVDLTQVYCLKLFYTVSINDLECLFPNLLPRVYQLHLQTLPIGRQQQINNIEQIRILHIHRVSCASRLCQLFSHLERIHIARVESYREVCYILKHLKSSLSFVSLNWSLDINAQESFRLMQDWLKRESVDCQNGLNFTYRCHNRYYPTIHLWINSDNKQLPHVSITSIWKCELPIQQQMDVVKQARSIVLTHETFTGLFAPNIATVAVTANKNNSQGLVPTSCSTTQTNGINTASEQHGNNHLIVIGNMLFTTTT